LDVILNPSHTLTEVLAASDWGVATYNYLEKFEMARNES
jgi:hypothetical protein